MTTAPIWYDESMKSPDLSDDELGREAYDRVHRLETELAELRTNLSDLAEIVAGDIKERRAVHANPAPPIAGLAAPITLPAPPPTAESQGKKPWMLVELYRETGLAIRMYFDPRYRVRRSTRIMVPAIFGLFILNYILFNYILNILVINFFAPIIERVIGVVLAILLYKVLAREVVRYRDTIAWATSTGVASYPVAVFHTGDDESVVSRQELE
jgi:hypothetical protein